MKFVDKIILIIRKLLRFVTCLLLKKFSIFQIHHFIILFPIFVLAYFLFLLCCLLHNICPCLLSIFLYFHCIAWLSFAGTIVKVTAKKGKKAVKKTLTFKATVKNPTLTLKAANEVAVGATEKVTATVKPASTKVAFSSSDETIATVDASGVVTGVKAGKVTITAKAGKTTKTVDMEVKTVILKSATQAEYNKIDVVIVGDTKDLKAGDFKVTNTATNGTVAKVGVTPVEVAAAEKTPVSLTTLDANGVVLGYTPLNNSDSSKGKVTATTKYAKGYVDGTNAKIL